MIRFENVSKRYREDIIAVNSLNLTIKEGEFFVLIGPSGCGKTTTLKMINRLMGPPYQGAPLLRKEILEKHPQLREILNKLGGKITDDEMREMNYKVGFEGAKAEQTAREYLVRAGLLR